MVQQFNAHDFPGFLEFVGEICHPGWVAYLTYLAPFLKGGLFQLFNKLIHVEESMIKVKYF